jgi:hypothetical protein
LHPLVAAARIAQGTLTMRAPNPSQSHTARRVQVAADGKAAPEPSSLTTVQLVGLIGGLTGILTALAFYFGWIFTDARSRYFDIDSSALGFSTQDYVLRSTSALFLPLGTILVLALIAAWVHELTTRALASGAQWPARVARWAIVVGLPLFVLGVIALFESISFSPSYLLPPASSGVGIALLAYGLYVLGLSRGPLGLTLVLLLVVLSAFWTTSDYAEHLGHDRAVELAGELGDRSHVIVFSPRHLQIELAAGVTEQPLDARDSAYRYRYAGLRLLVHSGGKYFMLPAKWKHGHATAIVLADTPPLRFEFGSSG